MTQFWRQVSALVVLLALLASACGSNDPTEVVVGDDTSESEAAEVDDAMEYVTDTASAVAADSAPSVAHPSDPVDEVVAAFFEDWSVASGKWEAAGLEDYDFTLVLHDGDRATAQVEVRSGEVTRIEATDIHVEGLVLPIAEYFTVMPDWTFRDNVRYENNLGYPTWMSAVDDEPVSLEISRFRSIDEYAEACSTAGLNYAGPSSTDPISTTHRLLLEAAQACDYTMLAYLADQGANELTLTFGGSDLDILWRSEKMGDFRLGILAELLSVEPTFNDGGYAVWPAEVADVDSQYLDWRVGISPDGEWLYFVAGD